MKVVDASAFIDSVSHGARGPALRLHLEDDLFAPDLLVSEVLSFFRRKLQQGKVTPPEADELAQRVRRAPIEYLHTWPYAEQIWQWRHTMTAYDATYVALTADLGATLVTTDLRLARAAEGFVPVIAV